MLTPARRFWKEVSVAEVEGSYQILLDNRVVKTPAGAELFLPTKTLALAVQIEWQQQGEKINAKSMPNFGFAVTAQDRVTVNRNSVLAELAEYGRNDLLCYREENDVRLAQRQDEIWQEYLDWGQDYYGIALNVGTGVMPHAQPCEVIEKAKLTLAGFDDFHLAGLHCLITVSGSLILGLAAAASFRDIESIFKAAFLDELWQQEVWGYDDEAAKRLDSLQKLLFSGYDYLMTLQESEEA